METLTDRVAVVTGAGSGIGRALALAYGAEGCKVVLADIQEDALAETEELLGSEGTATLAVRVDVGDADSVEALAAATIERFGEVHVVCNNAGVGGGGLIKNQALVDWKWVIDVNLWGVIHGIHFFLPHLLQADEAHIMSTSSVAGLVSFPGLGPYNGAKGAVVSIMETLHQEMILEKESNVGVSVLCPWVVDTNIMTAQRNRPDHLKRPKKQGSAGKEARRSNDNIAAALAGGMDPGDVADCVVDATKRNQFWILSHPELLEAVEERSQSLHTQTNPQPRTSFLDS